MGFLMGVQTETKTNLFKVIVANIAIFSLTILVGLGSIEGLLRLKNSSQQNYNIEMWRYARLLKIKSADPRLGHEHRSNVRAKLQGVEIALNSFGIRGTEPNLQDTQRKRILVLGSSNTLGWGVKEEDTMTARLQEALKDKAQVFNAGIGNYNTLRYVTLFENKLRTLKPDIVVVHYFVNDAEILTPGNTHWFLQHSQLAVMIYHAFQNLKNSSSNLSTLVSYYRDIYSLGSKGRVQMENALARLDHLSKEDGFKVVLVMVPDIHILKDYPFGFIHDHVRKVAESHGWTFVDFTEALDQVPAESLWAMPGDPHLNKTGHKIMADVLISHLK